MGNTKSQTMKNFSVIFGGVIAYILLVLYSGTVVYMTKCVVVHAMEHKAVDQNGKILPMPKYEFGTGIIYVVTTIGGLVSALVVAKLAVTEPGENPAIIKQLETAQPSTKSWSVWLVGGYLAAWLLTGLAALLVGVMFYPSVNSNLSDIGTTWLGLAVAAGYSYFGIKPSQQ
jgi:hypothetical protein